MKKLAILCALMLATPVFANPNVDYVMNYEELGALFVGRKIEILTCEPDEFCVESSKQARNFGVTGGVAKAVQDASENAQNVKPFVISGLTKDSIKQLKKMAKEGQACDGCNLVEVMCCEGGCVRGNGTINHNKSAYKSLQEFVDSSPDINTEK